MKPTKPINVTGNPAWKYRDSKHTDISATFRRIQREQQSDKKQAEAIVVGVIKPRIKGTVR